MSQFQLTICSDHFAESFWQKRLQHSSFIFTRSNELGRHSGEVLFLADELLTKDITEHGMFTRTIVASTAFTLRELGLHNQSCIRVCGWPGFYDQAAWEVAIANGQSQTGWEALLAAMHITPVWVPDIAGLIAPQTIARLANEAWYVWQDGVANERDIDTAMQLGTNYPLGPLAWAKKIGLKSVVHLLEKLDGGSGREEINAALLQAANSEKML